MHVHQIRRTRNVSKRHACWLLYHHIINRSPVYTQEYPTHTHFRTTPERPQNDLRTTSKVAANHRGPISRRRDSKTCKATNFTQTPLQVSLSVRGCIFIVEIVLEKPPAWFHWSFLFLVNLAALTCSFSWWWNGMEHDPHYKVLIPGFHRNSPVQNWMDISNEPLSDCIACWAEHLHAYCDESPEQKTVKH